VKDIIFFPAISLILISMALLASQHDRTVCPVGTVGGADTDYSRIVISGVQLNRFITNDQLDKPPCQADEAYTLTLTPTQIPIAPDAHTGPHFRLGTDIERTASNKTLRIIIRARALEPETGSPMEVIYYTGAKGDSGWQAFTLSKAFKDYAFDYKLPEAGSAPSVDYLGIRPGATGSQNGFEIERVELVNLSLQR